MIETLVMQDSVEAAILETHRDKEICASNIINGTVQDANQMKRNPKGVNENLYKQAKKWDTKYSWIGKDEPTNKIIELVRQENIDWLKGQGERKRKRDLSDEAMKAVNNIAELSNILQVKILIDLGDFFAGGYGNKCIHSKNIDELRTTCAYYVNVLYDYVINQAADKRIGVLQRLAELNPVCMEDTCNAIFDFVKKDSGGFVFEFDPTNDKQQNISRCANTIRNLNCGELRDGTVNENGFKQKMQKMVQEIFVRVQGKEASDGVVGLKDVVDFVQGEYGHFLLDCEDYTFDDDFFKDFVFETRAVGIGS